ncbi:MAG: DUF4239 domain-containing protein [Akkermansiaceae bacterium]|nr:DUF4239 domain-containing protein [Akkermansiaceae bacterium]MCP5547432.1 DUF4239 domain-containing protein [Akkermansiaceae bacterium]
MPDAIFHLTLTVTGVLIIGTLCIYSLAGTSLVRRFVVPRMKVESDDSEFTGAMVQAIMVFYGLAMALVAVSVWETHSGVSDTVSQEASRLAGLYRDVSSYPEPLRTELQKELLGYTNYLIDEAWPQQRDGTHPRRGIEWMNRFQTSLCAFEPDTEGAKILHAEAMRAYNHMLEARRLRMDAMLVKLPNTLWFVILFGAAVSLASTFFFKVRDARLHFIQCILLSVFVGLIIMLIVAFDRPFHGELGIDPEPYLFIRDQLMGS